MAPVLVATEVAGVEPSAVSYARDWQRAETLRGLHAAAALCQVTALLAGAGVRALSFKGVALGAQTGRGPAERFGVDLDVLVRPDDLLAAHRALLTEGFTLYPDSFPPIGDDPRTRFLRWSSCEQTLVRAGIGVDLHWRLVPGHLAGLDSTALLRRAVAVEVAGVEVLTLDPDAALAHVALHGAKDYWNRLRSIVDAHLLLAVAGASWDGAARVLGDNPAISEARAGVAVLRGEPESDPRAASWWIGGIEGRLGFDERDRPSGGWLRHLRRWWSLMPGPQSAAAILAHYLVPPASLARSTLSPSLWWVDALLRRPLKIARLVLLGKDPIAPERLVRGEESPSPDRPRREG
jgi:hypothetical protein